MGENRSIHAHDIVPIADHTSPPVVREVLLQFRADRTVVPASVEATVDFGGLKDEAFAFAEAHDFLHSGGIGIAVIRHGILGIRCGRERRWLPGKNARGSSRGF